MENLKSGGRTRIYGGRTRICGVLTRIYGSKTVDPKLRVFIFSCKMGSVGFFLTFFLKNRVGWIFFNLFS